MAFEKGFTSVNMQYHISLAIPTQYAFTATRNRPIIIARRVILFESDVSWGYVMLLFYQYHGNDVKRDDPRRQLTYGFFV